MPKIVLAPRYFTRALIPGLTLRRRPLRHVLGRWPACSGRASKAAPDAKAIYHLVDQASLAGLTLDGARYRRHRGASLSAGPANSRDHTIIDLANFFLRGERQRRLAGANVGNPPPPPPAAPILRLVLHRLCHHATTTGFRCCHPGHSCRDVLEDLGRSGEAGESLACN